MFFFKCDNAVLRVDGGRKYIKCKKLNDVCLCQRYCQQKRNYELSPMSQECKLNPKNAKICKNELGKDDRGNKKMENSRLNNKLPKNEKITITPLINNEAESTSIENLEDLEVE